MSVTFKQHCIIGIKYSRLSGLKSDEVYETIDIYDQFTRKFLGKGNVLKTPAVFEHSFLGEESGSLEGLCSKLKKKFPSLSCVVQSQDGLELGLIIGVEIGEYSDFGKIELLSETVSFEELDRKSLYVQRILGLKKEDISMFLFYRVS